METNKGRGGRPASYSFCVCCLCVCCVCLCSPQISFTALLHAPCVKRSTGHTHTHTPTENNTSDTDTHTHTRQEQHLKPPNEHLPQTLNNARRWRDDGACHLCIEMEIDVQHVHTLRPRKRIAAAKVQGWAPYMLKCGAKTKIRDSIHI